MDEAIFIELGERLTKALLTDDFDLFRSTMHLPMVFELEGSVAYTLLTVRELRMEFDLYHLAIKSRGITDIYRKATSIKETETGDFAVLCQMHLLAGSNVVVDPFESVMTLRETSNGWRFCKIRSSNNHMQWTLGKSEL